MSQPVPDALHKARVLAPLEEVAELLRHILEEVHQRKLDLEHIEAEIETVQRKVRLARAEARNGEGSA